jgi:hypothetical protein
LKTAVVLIRREPFYRRGAIESGLKRLGYSVSDRITRPTGKDSFLCIWNRKRGLEEQQAEQWERLGGSVLVFENAYLAKTDKTYYALSVHGHNGSGYFPVGPEDRFSKLGFPLKEWRAPGPGYRLVCGQRSIGSSTMASPPQWGERLVAKFKAMGVPHRWRPHPGNHAPKVPLVSDLKGASVCTIWSSSAGVMALVEGVEVHHSAPHWICAGGNGPGNREAALRRMAHGQHHHEEIATGEPFARILANLKDAKWP